ncbi:hypothetical protein HPG69_000416 [Diceros bicornis minor]|uniref:Uncharacterized protein n=1 Tax=Diceros bicornis minor TaxID=77932 RepID=A0A7J7FCZ0_DICBM|nr:hypothetical protein HPG69_000416 [Diceros bicornis minor]
MGRRGARMGDYADATRDGRPSRGESDPAAEGVWSSRDEAEEEDLPGGRGPFNRRLTDGLEWPMGSGVGAGRRLNPASALAGRGLAGGEREAGLKARRPIGARRGGGSQRQALGLEGGMGAGSASAPYSAPPAPASGTARGTPASASHADGSTACRAPPADEANGSFRPAHTEAAHWLLQRFRTPPSHQLRRKGLGLRPLTLLRVGRVVFSSDPARRPRLGSSLCPWTCP